MTRAAALRAAASVSLTLVLAFAGACRQAPADQTIQREPTGGQLRRLDGPSGAIAVDVGGTGSKPAVVFVHALGGTLGQWRAQLVHLRATRQAVALDLRGHGQSDPPPDDNYFIEAMSDDIATLISALAIDRPVLVGHDMGAVVALTFAGMHPERVKGLLLVDPSPNFRKVSRYALDPFMNGLRSPNYELTVVAFWEDRLLPNADVAVRNLILDDLRNTAKRTVVNSFEALVHYDDAVKWLRRYHGPTLLITTSVTEERGALHTLARVDHRLVLGTSHWPHMDKPAVFNAIMDDFLTRTDGTNSSPEPSAPRAVPTQ